MRNKDVVGYEGLYSVTADGRIWSYGKCNNNQNGKYLKLANHHTGYATVSLRKNKRRHTLVVHRIVAIALLPNPLLLPQINHKNGVKTDNRIGNLEWCTGSQNKLHAHRVLGVKNVCGSAHKNSKLSEEDVRKIKAEIGKVSYRQLGFKYKISGNIIRNIALGKAWRHV